MSHREGLGHPIPLALLATGFDLRGSDAEINGFLYFSGSVPDAGAARAQFTWHLLSGQCCQFVLRGRPPQVEALLRVAAVSSGWSFTNALGIAACIQAANENCLPFGFDNLEEATGNGLPIEGEVHLAQDKMEVARRLEALRDEIELSLAPDWQPERTWLAVAEPARANSPGDRPEPRVIPMTQSIDQFGRRFADEVMTAAADLAIAIHREAEPSAVTDSSPEVFWECLLFQTHVADRFGFVHFGIAGRDVFVDALVEKLTEAGTAAAFIPAMNEAQRVYQQYRALVPESGEGPAGTLCWEFAKRLTLRFWPSTPELTLFTNIHAITAVTLLGERFFADAPSQ